MKGLPQKVLVVEDEAITQRYIRDVLKRMGIADIHCCEDAKTARELFSKNPFDMVLMDINLEGPMDGIQLTREFLSKREIPIVFITAHSDEETMEEVLELSPFGFITKPFSGKNIEVTIQVAYMRFHLEQKEEKSEDQAKQKPDRVVISPTYQYSRTLRLLYQNGIPVELNEKHAVLIHILCENIDNCVDYGTLTNEIWGGSSVADSALRTLVWTLRKQLPDLPIISQTKVGYMIKRVSV